jgi:hypothetical protein
VQIRIVEFAAALALSLASEASAAEVYDFVAFGGAAPSSYIYFSLPKYPVPNVVSSDGSYFELANVTYGEGGLSECPCTGDLYFYTADSQYGGGLYTPAGLYVGVQLFSGPVTAPKFKLGDFGVDFRDLDGELESSGDVSITPSAPTPVPEPALWTLMLAGFSMIGWAARDRKVILTV